MPTRSILCDICFINMASYKKYRAEYVVNRFILNDTWLMSSKEVVTVQNFLSSEPNESFLSHKNKTNSNKSLACKNKQYFSHQFYSIFSH